MQKIVIFTDCWDPQVNGVVNCWKNIVETIRRNYTDYEIKIVTPNDFKYLYSVPSYPEFRIPIDIWNVFKIMKGFNPDFVHIATPEGTVGLAGKIYCWKFNKKYTTSYHTRLPEYIRKRYPIPLAVSYFYERVAHMSSKKVLVTTDSMKEDLNFYGFPFSKLGILSRGVDISKYKNLSRPEKFFKDTPILSYVGRVSVEKNLEAFLDIDLKCIKIVVGDGPDRQKLQEKYPDVIFTGYRFGDKLILSYLEADVFVFPSKSDTFGVVILEAFAAGTPVAAFDVPGPRDIITEGLNGYVGQDLKESIKKCLTLNRENIRESAKEWTWEKCAASFLNTLKVEL